MGRPLDDRRTRLLSTAAWEAEAKLKSELSHSRRGEHKSDRQRNVAVWIAMVALACGLAVAIIGAVGNMSGVVAILLILVGVPLLIWGAA